MLRRASSSGTSVSLTVVSPLTLGTGDHAHAGLLGHDPDHVLDRGLAKIDADSLLQTLAQRTPVGPGSAALAPEEAEAPRWTRSSRSPRRAVGCAVHTTDSAALGVGVQSTPYLRRVVLPHGIASSLPLRLSHC